MYRRFKSKHTTLAGRPHKLDLDTEIKITQYWADCPEHPEPVVVHIPERIVHLWPSSGHLMDTHAAIEYNNSGNCGIWNGCAHVRKSLGVDGSRSIKLNYETGSAFTFENEGCDGPYASTIEIGADLNFTVDHEAAVAGYVVGNKPTFVTQWDPELAHQREIHRSQAWSNFVPKIGGDFSLPRFIGELKDLKGLFKNVFSIYDLLRNRSGQFRGLMRRPGSAVASSHLAISFGWLPFVRDVQTIVSKLMGMEEEISTYIRSLNRRMTQHYEHGINASALSGFNLPGRVAGHLTLDSTYPWDHFGQVSDVVRHMTLTYADDFKVSSCKYHATMDYITLVPMAKGILRQIRGQYWGLKPGTIIGAQDIWNLIPFSFVLDWIYPVGRLIGTLDNQGIQAKTLIFNFCESIKYKARTTRTFTGVPEVQLASPRDTWSSWTVSPESAHPYFEECAYYRYLTKPVEASRQRPARLELPNGVELSFAWALGQSFRSSRHISNPRG